MRTSPDRIERLKSRLLEEAAGYRLVYEHETTSTNDLAAEAAGKRADVPCVFLADVQTNGRGRFDRKWESKEGDSLTFSLLLKPDCAFESFPMLTLVFGLAVCRAIRKQYEIPAQIKWPNDVVIDGKKVCGILTAAMADQEQVVIGAGINVRKTDFSEEIRNKAISLEEAGVMSDPDDLLISILKEFDGVYSRFLSTADMNPIREEYCSYLVNIGRSALVKEKNASFHAQALSIDEKGRLVLLLENGEIKAVDSGEVSVSGIYEEE